jgi:membrane protein
MGTMAGAAFNLVMQTVKEWREDKAERLAAALAYYTIFALGPLLLIAIAVAGLAFGEEAARGQVFAQLTGLMGAEGAAVIETAVQNANKPATGIVATIIGLVTLVLGAAGLFGHLKDALNTIWEVQPKSDGGVLSMVKAQFLSFTMVLGVGFLLLTSLVLSAVLAALGSTAQGLLPGAELFWQIVNFVISLAVITLLFAAIYKVLPDVTLSWNDVWIGAAATAILFTIGKTLIGLYLGNSSVGSAYGAAGSLLVVLIWVYYSAQILLLGAEFTQVYANTYGSRLRPAPGAEPVTEEARAQQGMPRKEEEPAGTARSQPAAPGGRPTSGAAASRPTVASAPGAGVARHPNDGKGFNFKRLGTLAVSGVLAAVLNAVRRQRSRQS